jgi:glycosyltransferase involved in cell wall biosynthesis
MTRFRAMTRTRYERVRVYDSLRSAHLERAREQVPASIVFGSKRYDFDESLTAGLDLISLGPLPLALTLWRSRLTTVEINEPLMRPGIARTALTVLVTRAASLAHRRPVQLVSYAIENQDPYLDQPWTGAKSRLRAWVEARLSRYLARSLDRLAYGTAGARELYQARLGRQLDRTATTLVPALPSPCDCVAATAPTASRVSYVGALEVRKGFDRLMQAWPVVTAGDGRARLSIVGKGALVEQARDFATCRTEVELLVDPPRSEIHRLLRESRVLVLLSQPSATWREQVGLPIVEGLAHGCEIVTTDQTGVADWLIAHGHRVLAPNADAATIGDAVLAAIASARSRAAVLADLPAVDGRLQADKWLFTGSAG